MKVEQFNELFDARVAHCRELLVPKGEEYSRGGNRLHNFITAGRYDNESPEKALWGMLKKHLVSIQDTINDIEAGMSPPGPEFEKQKITDAINYLTLLEGLIVDRRNNYHKAKKEEISHVQV